MTDFGAIDKMFEAGHRSGIPIGFMLFDKRALLSWEQVVDHLYLATGARFTREDLISMAARGWIPILENSNDLEAGIGIPLYADSRIQLLLELERAGYAEDELRAIAKWEEATVDEVLTTDELAYVDDDLEVVIAHMKCVLLRAEERGEVAIPVDLSGTVVSCEQYKRKLLIYERFLAEGIPEKYQYSIAKVAYRVRAVNEIIRVELLEMDRAKIRAGYSHFIVGNSQWQPTNTGHTFNMLGVHWGPTIEIALAHEEGDVPTIRAPGFLLQGDKVVSTGTLRPRDYEQLWKKHNLDNYLTVWSVIRGEKYCLNCFSKLPDSSDSRRKYCGEKCRNVMKQRRHRLNNPDAIFEAQRKYYSSFTN